MINTYNQTPSSRQGSSSTIMKMIIWVFTLLFVAQIIGTCFFGVYFYKRLDKQEEEKSFYEDYIFLKTIHTCVRGGNIDPTLLNCNKVIDRLRSFISEVIDGHNPGILYGRIDGSNHNPSTAVNLGEKPNQSRESTIVTEKVPVAIHLVGKNSNNQEVLQWMSKGYASMTHNITYTNDKLEVEVPGVYYVYSQVSFCVNTIQSSRAPFVQYIYLHRQHETDKLLLKGANADFSQTGECALHSIQQGAVFTFKQHDQLYVNVTDTSRMNYSPGATYFGMYKL
ncbi:CD40 ligand [Pelodytes ibericus]